MKKVFTSLYLTGIYALRLSSDVYAIESDEDGSVNLGGSGAVDIGNRVKGFFHFTCIQEFVFRLVDVAIILSGVLMLVYLVWGGLEWLISGGDKSHVENARNKMTSAVVGVTIVACSFAIWKIILVFFGIDLQNICGPYPIQ